MLALKELLPGLSACRKRLTSGWAPKHLAFLVVTYSSNEAFAESFVGLSYGLLH